MNQRIERAYENRPKNWVFEASVAVVFLALLALSLIHIFRKQKDFLYQRGKRNDFHDGDGDNGNRKRLVFHLSLIHILHGS